jgi:predicted house-cleaning NTP pyrophosphatase (Maf/HAM1 superfamily)
VGSYRIEDAGIALFERVRGDDYTGIVGLPLMGVAGLLRDVGLLPGGKGSEPAPEGATPHA